MNCLVLELFFLSRGHGVQLLVDELLLLLLLFLFVFGQLNLLLRLPHLLLGLLVVLLGPELHALAVTQDLVYHVDFDAARFII
jgi:4-amino-4-deoxy-L-arabinose transferase-like glycosyltransferase